MTHSHPAGPRRVSIVAGGLGFGGATTLLSVLASELSRNGWELQIISLQKTDFYPEAFLQCPVQPVFVDDNNPIFEDRLLRAYALLRAFKPGVVVAWLGLEPLELFRYLPSGVGRVCVQHVDCEAFYRQLIPYASYIDRLVGVSETVAQNMGAVRELSGIARSAVPNGIPVPPYARAANDLEPLRLLYFGRLEKAQKRVDLLPAIQRELLALGIPAQWTIAGEGSFKQQLQNEMQEAPPLQSVRFLETVSYPEIPALLQKNDIFLLVSDSEGLPMSLLEACAQGMIPVVSDIESGIRDVLDPDCALFIEQGNPSAYARAIAMIHKERALGENISKAAHERIRTKFSSSQMRERWIELLQANLSPKTEWRENIKVRQPHSLSSMKFNPIFRPVRKLLKKFL